MKKETFPQAKAKFENSKKDKAQDLKGAKQLQAKDNNKGKKR